MPAAKTIAVPGNVIITPTMTDTSNLVNQLNKSGPALGNSIIPALQTTYTVAQLNALTGMTDGATAYVSNGDITVGWGLPVGASTGANHLSVHYSTGATAWLYG